MPPKAGSSGHSGFNNSEERSKYRYNPFRKLRRRTKDLEPEQEDDSSHNKIYLPPPTPEPQEQKETPYIIGQLFPPLAVRADSINDGGTFNAGSANGPLYAQNRNRMVDEEKTSISLFDSNLKLRAPWLLGLTSRLCRLMVNSAAKEAADPLGVDNPRKYAGGNRKRRLIVVEYGNTDEVAEGKLGQRWATIDIAKPMPVTPGTVLQSWKEPIYSEMAISGYAIDEHGHQQSRASRTLSDPLKESLRKVCMLCLDCLAPEAHFASLCLRRG